MVAKHASVPGLLLSDHSGAQPPHGGGAQPPHGGGRPPPRGDGAHWSIELALPPGASVDRIPALLSDLVAIVLRGGALHRRSGPAPRLSPRRARLRLDVAFPEFWSRGDVLVELHAVLEGFWGTRLTIEIESGQARPALVCRNAPGTLHRDARDEDAPRVVAFSPDLDSVAAAIRHMAREPRNLVLVTLDALPPDAAHQRPPPQWLVQHLLGHAAVRLATATVNHAAADAPGADDPLGLLHVVLTAAVAAGLGADRACFYENGISNLGLPITTASLAGPAPCSVHPEIAAALGRLVSHMSNASFGIENPFLDKTPTEVVQNLLELDDAGDEPLARLDAFHSFARNENERPARIDQCIATLGALLSRPAHFAWGERAILPELLTPMNENLADAFIRAIRELPDLPDRELVPRLGHAPPLRAPSDRAIEPLMLALLRRHAGTVRHVLTRLARHCAPRLVEGTLPPASLLIRAAVPREAQGPDTRVGQPTFRKRADRWELWFEQGEPIYLNHAKGLIYLHILLQHPERVYSAAELRAVAAGHGRVPSGNLGMNADKQAIAAYKDRLDELRMQVDTANDNRDSGLAERAQQEIHALETELRRCLRLGGRPREATELERARKAVSNALHRALQKIRTQHPGLAAHLDATLSIGIYLCYRPGQDIAWLT